MKTVSFVHRSASAAVVVLMLLGTACVLAADFTDADVSYSVTDGTGKTFTFSDEPSHIATIGVGVTATAIQIGALDKIVVTDKYSKTNTSVVFSDLQSKIADGTVRANGSGYSTGHSDVKADLVYVADNGKFDKEKDAVIITGSYTTLESLVSDLNTAGFKNVLVWKDITDYADLADFVKSVSITITGKVTSYVDQMKYVSKDIKDELAGVEKRDAMYVTYSGGDYKVGNTGSLANSMIIAAGGNSISVDSSQSKSTYGDKNTVANLIINHPDAVIFLDSSVASDDAKVAEIRAMGSGTTLVALEPLWNNYSIDSMNGVWTMAKAMYPDIFSGDIPVIEPDDGDNTMLYIGAAVAVVAIVCIVGFLFLRKN